jgi:FixJ family two-component response regulator
MLDTKCLILDIAMPGIGGLDLKRELDRRELKCPVIFITARRDEGLRSRLLEDGAVDCLFKPFSDTALQRALDLALKGK